MVQAIGIAATQVTGLREMFGSHTKSFHPGRAAQSGLLAAMLAQGGYTSSEDAIGAKRGWAAVVGAGQADLPWSLEKWLGIADGGSDVGLASRKEGEKKGRWEVLRNSFKPFPCGIVIHPIIDACVQIHNDMTNQGLQVQDITTVHARVHPLVLELTGKREPKDGLEGKFSVYHGAAIGLIYGRGMPSEYEDSVVQDASVVAIRDKVQAKADEKMFADETYVKVTMNDGAVLKKHVQHAVGSLEIPMDDEMLKKKFMDQCREILGAWTENASEMCWSIESLDDVSKLSPCI